MYTTKAHTVSASHSFPSSSQSRKPVPIPIVVSDLSLRDSPKLARVSPFASVIPSVASTSTKLSHDRSTYPLVNQKASVNVGLGWTTAPTAETGLPTPPPSPDLIEELVLPPTPTAPPPVVCPSTPPIPSSPRAPSSPGPLPIALLLNTSHQLPHAGTFKLAAPSGILGVLGGNRILDLQAQTLWDRMPYSPSTSTATVVTKDAAEEQAVEAMLGGKPQPNGSPFNKDHLGSIFVQPPTPEREREETTFSPTPVANGLPPVSPPIRTHSPNGESRSIPSLAHKSMPIPLQALPEVRSPPRTKLAMTQDSLQLIPRRGRRPRLFAFTEIGESSGSGSSANSSANNSRENSPERDQQHHHHHHHPHPHHHELNGHSPLASSSILASPTTPTLASSGMAMMPRRNPIRAKSETHLPTLASSTSQTSLSVPTPLSAPRRRENGLKLDFTGIVPVSTAAEVQAAYIPSPYSAKLIRKKSGEIVRPALKYTGPLESNGTPATTPSKEEDREGMRPRFESKSLPATPSFPKYVHFDTHLERVKLFLQDQKPQVVSRSGSPTVEYTTSEGEEYPFPSTDDERDPQKAKVLTIKLPNFPTHHAPDSEFHLESLFLEEDRKSLKGIVLCKNLAFQKWVAIRFTFDWWQTTSEVTATFKESIREGRFDRFQFQIRLTDMMTKIEERTLFIALRYNTDGREIWDSNGGQNYQVIFERSAPPPAKLNPARHNSVIQAGMGKAVGGTTSQWSVGGNDSDRMADLRARLSRLTADDLDHHEDDGPQLSPNRQPSLLLPGAKKIKSPSGSPNRDAADVLKPELSTGGSAFGTRYGFSNSFKEIRENRMNGSPSSSYTNLEDLRTGLLSYPAKLGANGNGNGIKGSSPNGSPPLGKPSPQVSPSPAATKLPTDHFFSPTTASTVAFVASPSPIHSSTATIPLAIPDLHVQGPSPPPLGSPNASSPPIVQPMMSTNTSPKLARPPMAPRTSSSPAGLSSPKFAKVLSPEVPMPHLDSSSSLTDTPTSSPRSPGNTFSALPKWSPGPASAPKDRGKDLGGDYASIIAQFCWVGNAPPAASDDEHMSRRSVSSSSLDTYFQESANGVSVSGISTPRASSGFTSRSPSTSGSYYTAAPFSNTTTPTRKSGAEIEEVEKSVRALGSLQNVPPRIGKSLPGHMSPPVRC